ncbi:DNA-dependent protein kinase catalytic subunit [Nephila pilipes]|uniref:DNA-dependent protein kinase catalytic subunit n=1 Tax=Nephila pilipes TaxID=299642 RepID=A0A8X6PX38_NEPPI|nr:DNA-dependent protein kinase catalytic subunit [Nephila pilipes]
MGDFIELIRRHLETLKLFGESKSCFGKEGTISDVIETIRDNYNTFNLKTQDREILNAHLLSKQHGLLGFLKNIVSIKEIKSIKHGCFKLLDDILDQSRTLVQDYGSDMMDVCLVYVGRDVGADLKKASLITISKVLEYCCGCQGEKRIDIKYLIDKLYIQLTLRSKLTSTVKEEILCLIGVIAHYYPEEFIPYQEKMLHLFLQELKVQVNSKVKAFDYNIVAGCLQALKEYLYNFSVLYSEDPENSYFIFNVSRKMISKPDKFSTKTSPVIKAALQLLAAHAPQFELFIFENCVDLYDGMMLWVQHQNRDMQKIGRDAIGSILKVTAEMVSSKYEEDKDNCTKIFSYFMRNFRDIFLSNDSSSKILKIAVIAYGLFAKDSLVMGTIAQCTIYRYASLAHVVLTVAVVSRPSSGIGPSGFRSTTQLPILPLYLLVSENIIFSLEKLTIFQINKFPKVPSAYNFVVPKVVIRIMLSVQPKRELFLKFLAEVVYQGLVKTCSHPVVVEAEALKDKNFINQLQNQNEVEYRSSMKIVTYKDYVYFWKSMLNVVQLKELNSLGIPLEHRQCLMEAIYDELIHSSLSLISKLDLSLSQHMTKNSDDAENEEIEISSDPLHGVHPNNMIDYYIFINLVDFLRDILRDNCIELFSKWVFTFGKEMIFHAAKHPYHSGFYKLISLNLSICSHIEFFKEIKYNMEDLNVELENISEDKLRSYQLFSKFVAEVAVRQEQFKDELLASCLQVLLSLPIEIVLHDINILIPALEHALKLGISYLPLASAAISALEKWCETIPLNIIKPYFAQLLPHLNYYLLASTIQDDTLGSSSNKKKVNVKKAHKMSSKSVKKLNRSALDVIHEDPELLKIQHRIVKFLGRLGENNIALLENAYEKLDAVAIAWDSVCRNHLKYSVPFQDMKPDIYFDDFLPLILEIATKSTVRQAKVAACESLHSLVLFMIGRGSILPDHLQIKYSMEALYNKLFPGLLELACDVEQVTKQLFRPLVLQIIHWFTCARVSKCPETSIILLCLWDGVTDSHNAALRDFSALCLREFFQWSIKQSSSGKQKQTENLLNKLHSFSLHPNAFKRMGAALTFNNIYNIFREEEFLVKKYTIQLLIQFVESLAIAHTDNISLGTQKQCITALNHIQKILKFKHELFLKTDVSRKKPECLEEATLQCAVLWLLRQCGCTQTECRHKCMELVAVLAPFIPGFKSHTSFLMTYSNDGQNIFEDVFENVLKNFSNSGMHNHKTLKSIVLWLEALQTSMDCYHWAFSKQFLLQNVLYGEKYSFMISSVKIFKTIEYYIENIVKESLMSVMNRDRRDQSELFTPEETLKFNKLKCTVLIRLFTFIVSVFSPDAKWFNEQFVKVLWNSSLWEIILLSVVDPSSLGFDMTDPEVSLKLPENVSIVIKRFSEKDDFQVFCSEYIKCKKKYNLMKILPISLLNSKQDYMQVMQLLKGYELLITNGIETSTIFQRTMQIEIITSLLDSIWNDSLELDGSTFKKRTLTPIAFSLAEQMLSVCYNLELKADEMAMKLINSSHKSGNSRSGIEKGLLIFSVFADSICTFASRTPDTFVKTIVNFLTKTTFTEVAILIKFIDHVACTKMLRKKFGKDVVKAYLMYWVDINKWLENHSEADSKYSVLSIMTKMLLIDSEVSINKSGSYSISLFPTYIHLLKMQNNDLNFIESAFDILPFFIEDSRNSDTLKSCIEEIRAVYFPLQSTELVIGSSSYHVYISSLKKVTPAKDAFLARKIAYFKLLELMYRILTKDLLHSKDSQIVESYLGQKPNQGNELTADIIKLSLEFKRTSYEMEPEYKELLRKLNCARYNALMTVISCTQKEVKFYNAFLFKENPTKNERVWERIVDAESKLEFDMEIDTSLSRKKKFIVIRHNIRNENEVDDNVQSSDVPSSLNLLGSEHLGLSSLAEDVSKFVFSTHEPVFSHQKENETDIAKVKSKKLFTDQKHKGSYMELDDDELNRHDSMEALCCLLQQMKAEGLIPDEQTEAVPPWLNCIIQSLEDGMLAENIRLFLGRVIINNAKILQPYAKALIRPLLDLIILGTCGFSLNYYILDIIIAILSWAPNTVPQGDVVIKANEVLKFLIKNCEHSRKEIFRSNLEVIKTLLECWKNGLEIPYDVIYEKMKDSCPDYKKNVYGIQLLGVVLSCDFPPFDCQNMPTAQSYFLVLLKNITHKYKEVYASASEVVALSLKHLLRNEDNLTENQFFLKVVHQLEILKDKDEDRFLYCLNKIHVSCPKIADKVCEMENGYQELKVIGFFEDLEKKDETSQKLLLQTLENLIPDLSCDDILYILPGIVNIHAQPSIASRLALYKILFLLFETFCNNVGAKEKEITRYAQETLLIGLADPDPSIRLIIDNFWSNEKRLPTGTKERLLALMKNMFSPMTEESFLQYATFLLLERTSHSPDFKRKIFEHPLSKCNFQAYQIQTSWRKRHMVMSPLFTESVSSTYSSFASLDPYTSSTLDQNLKIKATQKNAAFPETMDVDEDLRKQGTYNWLTERTDTFSLQDFSFDSGYGTINSMSKSFLIANKSDVKLSEKLFPRTMQIKNDEKNEKKSSAWLLRRRFYKDKRKDSETFARQELRRQDRRKEIKKEQQIQRDAQVVMYRQYRIGELPDIEISNSEVIKPIQALAMNDGMIAKLLFKSLLVAIYNFIKEELPEYLETFNEEIGSCFEKILQSSYLYTPNVISFCLEALNQLQDIKFDVEIVFNACIGSNQQSIGILLLETKILNGFSSEPFKKKKRPDKHILTEESNYWMKLAELYKSIEIYDVVNGIFSLTMGSSEANRKALNYESSGQYFNAVMLYNELYDNTSDEHDQAEKDFWDKSALFCMNKLCKWTDLENAVIGRFTTSDSHDLQAVWEDQYMKDNYLPYLVRSKIKQLLEGKAEQSLLTFFDAAREDEEKKIHIETHFSEELALLYIVQDKFDIARQYSSACLSKFLKEWQNLSPLALGVQQACLQKLLKYVELVEFLDLMKRNEYTNTISTIRTLKIWQKRFPNSVDPVDIWDDVITNRHLYMKKLQEKLKDELQTETDQNDSCKMDSEDQNEFDFKKLLLETSVFLKLRFAENCADQKNYLVAVSTLKSIYKVSKSLDGSMWSKFIEAYCSINNRRSLCEIDRKLDIILESWKQLGELGKRCGGSISQTKLLSQTFEILAKMFMNNEINLDDVTNEQKKKILTIAEGKLDKTEIISQVLDKSFSCLKDIIKTSHQPAELKNAVNDASKKDIASAYMELANFCNCYLNNESILGYSPQNIPSFSEFPQVLVESLLDALKFGSKDALLFFPRLLQIIESNHSCLPLFQKKTSDMPCWLFIGWIDQMLVLLDKPEAKAVHSIIENIANLYPDAIVYSFHLSCDSYDFTRLKDGNVNKCFVEKIKQILEKQTLISDFVAALEHLSVPCILFKEYFLEIEVLVSCNASDDKILQCFSKMCEKLFFDKVSKGRSVPMGPLQKRFSEEYRPRVLAACGQTGSKLVGISPQAALNALKNLMVAARQKDTKVTSLKSVSPWLSEFKQWKYPTQIEIPGQYTGKSKPLPEYHVKVAGFDEKILVLTSLTSPRRIIIRGNDEKEYKILVKSGEDLRQDARIQQLFSVMNDIYANDIHCSQRHLSLRTYKVVPLSNRLGLIEWVDNTIVLHDFLKDGMSDEERRKFYTSGEDVALKRFNNWVTVQRNAFELYSTLYMQKNRKECVEKYEELVNLVPKNLLVKSFTKLSSSPEAFMVLRNKFAQSHAVICLSQWVLGIGDRHLGNFLIDKSTGFEVGIDFGHAFGSATQFLPVPELVPFRLTPQYLQLMGPLQVKGIYESTMIHALSAICNRRDLLLNVMDIFIKEPTLDWEVHSNRQSQYLGLDVKDKKDDWFPKQRIAIARAKLEGANPCHISRKELELGHGMKEELFKKMESVCLGSSEYNVRARMKLKGLSVEEQVDCLIDMATDPHVLLLVYYGWNPWM